MNQYLIQTANPASYFPEPEEESPFRAAYLTGDKVGDDDVVFILHTEAPNLPGDEWIQWSGPDGAGETKPGFYAVRPLGNYPATETLREGSATKQLTYLAVDGFEQRRLGEGGKLYPEENSPFAVDVRHKYFGGNANPAWDGWGWRAEIVGDATSRDPSARAIGIYRDPDCTDYYYTTGAFSAQDSEWQTDDDGSPLPVWATEYNEGLLGFPNAEPADVHHAVLLGAAQEGYQTLGAAQTTAQHLYWAETQQDATPRAGAAWQDSGAVVSGQAGQLYWMDLESVVSRLEPGEKIQMNGFEVTFVSVWPGTATLVQIDPFVALSTGDKLWWRR